MDWGSLGSGPCVGVVCEQQKAPFSGTDVAVDDCIQTGGVIGGQAVKLKIVAERIGAFRRQGDVFHPAERPGNTGGIGGFGVALRQFECDLVQLVADSFEVEIGKAASVVMVSVCKQTARAVLVIDDTQLPASDKSGVQTPLAKIVDHVSSLRGCAAEKADLRDCNRHPNNGEAVFFLSIGALSAREPWDCPGLHCCRRARPLFADIKECRR